MQKVIVRNGWSALGIAVQRAAASGQLVSPTLPETVSPDVPSAKPAFQGPFSGPAPLYIAFQLYLGDVYVNPNGGTVNVANAIFWNPTP